MKKKNDNFRTLPLCNLPVPGTRYLHLHALLTFSCIILVPIPSQLYDYPGSSSVSIFTHIQTFKHTLEAQDSTIATRRSSYVDNCALCPFIFQKTYFIQWTVGNLLVPSTPLLLPPLPSSLHASCFIVHLCLCHSQAEIISEMRRGSRQKQKTSNPV